MIRLTLLQIRSQSSDESNIAGLDFNTDTIRNTLIVCALLFILGAVLRSQLRVGVPSQLQNATEAIVEYINNLTEETLQGQKTSRSGHWPSRSSRSCLIANWFGVGAGLKSPTIDWNTTLGLALSVLRAGAAHQHPLATLGGYFKHLLLVPPYFPLTVIDELAKPITLSFRLYFNIFVGELLLTLIIMLIPTCDLVATGGALDALSSLFIGGVQAFIFTVLTVSYIAVATGVKEEHG